MKPSCSAKPASKPVFERARDITIRIITLIIGMHDPDIGGILFPL